MNKMDYVNLLRTQVEAEIDYLVRGGHDSESITSPCVFCVHRRNNVYSCVRLRELRTFQNSLNDYNENTPQSKMERRHLEDKATESLPSGTINVATKINNLPLLNAF